MTVSTSVIIKSTTLSIINTNVYLPIVLEEPNSLVNLFELLKTAEEGDNININVNCCGGGCLTGIQLINEMLASKANIKTILNGTSRSMATFIMLAGDIIEIYPNSSFMIHYYSGVIEGKGNEMRIKSDFDDEFYKKFFKEQYKYFLTKKEIKQVINGKDIWLYEKEIIERLKTRVKKLDAKLEKEELEKEELEKLKETKLEKKELKKEKDVE